MKILMRSTLILCAFAALSFESGQALAGCGSAALGAPSFKPMVYHEGDRGSQLRTWYGPYHSSAITGLWKFTFTAKGDVGTGAPANALPLPDGAPVDAGFVTWHDDGTELMNSGRAAASGSFCMGVWKQVGPSTYKLNHWALSWIPDYHPGATNSWSQIPGGIDETFQALGPANIRETLTLSRDGKSYQGVFLLTQYVNDGTKTPITDTDGAPIAFVIVGTVSATRITVE
jgi:hypothetical protein